MLWKSLQFGWQQKCPCCGQYPIHESWAVLIRECPGCQTPIRKHEDDTWFFMYMSTAFITGIFILTMFLVSPSNPFIGRTIVAVSALICIIGTVPRRKGLAIALDWVFRQKTRGV